MFRNMLGSSGGRAVAIPPALPEPQPSVVVVVRAAPERDLVRGRFAAQGARNEVMELHEPAFVAAMTVGTDVGAASAVPHPHDPLDLGGNVGRVRRSS